MTNIKLVANEMFRPLAMDAARQFCAAWGIGRDDLFVNHIFNKRRAEAAGVTANASRHVAKPSNKIARGTAKVLRGLHA